MSEAALEQAFPSKGQAGADPASIPLDKIDVTDSELWVTDTHWGYFERLRNEAPVHYCAESILRPVLVGHEIRRHRRGREGPGDLFLGADDHGRGHSRGFGHAERWLHHDGRARVILRTARSPSRSRRLAT